MATEKAANPQALVDEAERLLKNITPGEWTAGPPAWFRGRDNPEAGKRPITAGAAGVVGNVYGRENAEFIADAPRLVRDLSAALRALQEERDSLKAAVAGHERMAASSDRVVRASLDERDGANARADEALINLAALQEEHRRLRALAAKWNRDILSYPTATDERAEAAAAAVMLCAKELREALTHAD